MVNEWGDRAQVDFKKIFSRLYDKCGKEKQQKLILSKEQALDIIEKNFHPYYSSRKNLCNDAHAVIKLISKKIGKPISNGNIVYAISRSHATYSIEKSKVEKNIYSLYSGTFIEKSNLYLLVNEFDKIIFSAISDTFFFPDYDQAVFISNLCIEIYKHFLPYQEGEKSYVDQ